MDPMFKSFLTQIAKPFNPDDLPPDDVVNNWHENGRIATSADFGRFLSEYSPADWHAVMDRLALEEGVWSSLIAAILSHPKCDHATLYRYYLSSAPISYLLEGQPHPAAAALAPHFESAIRPKAPNFQTALARLRSSDLPSGRFAVLGHLPEMYDARTSALTALLKAYDLDIPDRSDRAGAEKVHRHWIVDRGGIQIPLDAYAKS